jgi:hypothetical protein
LTQSMHDRKKFDGFRAGTKDDKDAGAGSHWDGATLSPQSAGVVDLAKAEGDRIATPELPMVDQQ